MFWLVYRYKLQREASHYGVAGHMFSVTTTYLIIVQSSSMNVQNPYSIVMSCASIELALSPVV